MASETALAARSPLDRSCALTAFHGTQLLLLFAERGDAGVVELGADLLVLAQPLEVGVKSLANQPPSLTARLWRDLIGFEGRHFPEDAAEALLPRLGGLGKNMARRLLGSALRAPACCLESLTTGPE